MLKVFLERVRLKQRGSEALEGGSEPALRLLSPGDSLGFSSGTDWSKSSCQCAAERLYFTAPRLRPRTS